MANSESAPGNAGANRYRGPVGRPTRIFLALEVFMGEAIAVHHGALGGRAFEVVAAVKMEILNDFLF